MADTVVLIGAEFEENLSLRYLTAAVAQEGLCAEIIALNHVSQQETLLAKVLALRPLLVGISVPFQTRAAELLRLSTRLRENGYEGHICVGGHFATFEYEAILQHFAGIDSVVRHEGELTLCELCRRLVKGGSLQNVAGLVSRGSQGLLVGPLRLSPPQCQASMGDMMHLVKKLISTVLIASAVSTISTEATGREWKQSPVEVSNGPLLWTSRYRGNSSVRIFSLLDVEQSSELIEVIRIDSDVWPEDRISQDRLLVSTFGGLSIVDLRAGTGTELLQGRDTQLVDIQLNSIFFGEVIREDWGTSLEPNGDTYKIVDESNSSYRLYVAHDAGNEPPICLWDQPIRRVVARQPDSLLVLPDKPEAELWWVYRDGRVPSKALDLDPDWAMSKTTAVFSPNLTHLAFGVTRRDDYYQTRDLVVYDWAHSKRVFELSEIPMAVSPISSFSPVLLLTWQDEHRLRLSETVLDPESSAKGHFRWVEIDITTGERRKELIYSDLGLRHVQPPSGPLIVQQTLPRERVGMFEKADGLVYFAGDTEPAANYFDREGEPAASYTFSVSPDGRWVPVRSDRDDHTVLLDATRRSVVPIGARHYKRRHQDYCWIAAASE
jgi:hypothetical protein